MTARPPYPPLTCPTPSPVRADCPRNLRRTWPAATRLRPVPPRPTRPPLASLARDDRATALPLPHVRHTQPRRVRLHQEYASHLARCHRHRSGIDEHVVRPVGSDAHAPDPRVALDVTGEERREADPV